MLIDKSGAAPQVNHRKVNRGEPGCNVMTEFKNGYPIVERPMALVPPPPTSLTLLPPSSFVRSLIEGGQTEEIVPLLNNSESLAAPNLRFIEKAHFRASLVLALKENIARGNGKTGEKIDQFVKQFNAGLILPNIHEELGDITVKTLYRFKKKYEDYGIDGLILKYGGAGKSKITNHEKKYLLNHLLNQNKPDIADAIRKCKRGFGDNSPSSPATLRRYVNAFKSEFPDVWIYEREGQKAWNDKCAPYVSRAWWKLEVGDTLVGDGKKLDFQVINPHTGKACRAILIMFWDWYSSYPVGWEVMLTENVQGVSTALRNAILTLGKIPAFLYLDNGKAFKAKCFTQNIILEDTELPGMFDQLGIKVIWATKYNAQAKPIERIFGVLKWLEKEVPSYVGDSVGDKPAYLRPNENRAKKLRGDWTPKLEQVNDLIRQWCNFYIVEPLRGRKNQTAKELFDPGRGPGVDPKALCFLMMKTEVKSVRRGRLTFDGFDWAGECLYGLKSKVIVRYSLSDRRQIYVFDLSDQFLGVVEPVEATAPRDYEAARRIMSERRGLLRDVKALSEMAKTASPEVIDLLSRRDPDLCEYIEKKGAEEKPETKLLSVFIDGIDYGNELERKQDELEGRPKYKPPKDWSNFKGDFWEKYDYKKAQDPATWTPEDLIFFEEFEGTPEYRAVFEVKPSPILSGG